jgi:hypothetical protein
MKITTSFRTLMQLASACGKAEQVYKKDPSEENKKKFEEAEEKHEHYKQLCLQSDNMIVEGLNYYFEGGK